MWDIIYLFYHVAKAGFVSLSGKDAGESFIPHSRLQGKISLIQINNFSDFSIQLNICILNAVEE